MKKKLKLILLVACALVFALLATGCQQMTLLEQYKSKGYKILVTYDANGGKISGRSNAMIIDAYKPESFTADGSGNISIQLTSPTDPSRRPAGSDRVTVARNEYFYTGWFQKRELQLNADGKPVNEAGEVLWQRADGWYVVESTKDDEKPVVSTPVYTYSEPWDFENDRLVYNVNEGGFKEITLYAGWVKNFEFRYFYESVDPETSAVTWKQEASTSFDYKAVNDPATNKADQNTMWLPVVVNGAMKYDHHIFADNSKFKFPVKEGTTFVAAYLDEACTQPITDSFVHTGTYEPSTATAINPVQNVYVKTLEGTRYWISTPEQLFDNPDLQGDYEIQNDLDFAGKSWPVLLSTGEFKGKMHGKDGASVTIRNVTAVHNGSESTLGGLFGAIGAGAQIKNVAFDNVTFDLKAVPNRLRDARFGLFAGVVSDEATFENVSVNGMMRIGAIALASPYYVNVFANDGEIALANVTKGAIRLQIYGTPKTSGGKTVYEYTVKNPSTVTVDEHGSINLSFGAGTRYDDEFYEITLS